MVKSYTRGEYSQRIFTYNYSQASFLIFTHTEAVINSSAGGDTNEENPIIDENIRESEPKALSELEALSTPCHVRFICSLVSNSVSHEIEHSPKKKRKLSPDEARKTVTRKAASFGMYAELEWVEGEDKDTLHQILQYLNNKLIQQHF